MDTKKNGIVVLIVINVLSLILLYVATFFFFSRNVAGKNTDNNSTAQTDLTIESETPKETNKFQKTKLSNDLEYSLKQNLYKFSAFSVTYYEIVNAGFQTCQVNYYLPGDSLGSHVEHISSDMLKQVAGKTLVHVYFSGNVAPNPEVSHVTNYNEDAMEVVLCYDANGNLTNALFWICDDLQLVAIYRGTL